MDFDTSFYAIAGTLVMLGVGFALFSSPNMNAIMGAVSPRYYGTASGTVGTMRLIGQMVSMALVTVIFSMVIGKTAMFPLNYEQFLKSMHVCLVIFTGFCSAGIVFSLFRGTMQRE